MNPTLFAARRFAHAFTLPALLPVVFLLGTTLLSAQTIAATTNDVVTLRQMLATAAAWDAKGKKAFDAPVLAELDSLWRRGYDPLLRVRARELVPTLEKAALARPHVLAVAEAVKGARGTVRFEGSGPQWLREGGYVSDRQCGHGVADGLEAAMKETGLL